MSKGRILVVEDDFDISNMLRIYFTGQGYDVQVASRGGDALEKTRKQPPQLEEFRYSSDKRKNNPPARIAAEA